VQCSAVQCSAVQCSALLHLQVQRGKFNVSLSAVDLALALSYQ
jgi:hypothetical protein